MTYKYTILHPPPSPHIFYYGTTNHWINILSVLSKHDIDYVLCVDADEYLYIKNKRLTDIIYEYSPFDAIKINWLMFGSSNLKTSQKSILDSFTQCCAVVSDVVKSLTKISSINMNMPSGVYGPHTLPLNDNSIVKTIFNNTTDNTTFREPVGSIKYCDAPMYIAHYSIKDVSYYIDKITLPLFWQTHYSSVRNISIEYINSLILFINEHREYFIDYIHNNDNVTNLLILNKYESEIHFAIKYYNSINKYSNQIHNYDLVNRICI